MADKLKPGDGKGSSKPKTPAPILLPSGRKHRSGGRVGRLIQDLIPSSPPPQAGKVDARAEPKEVAQGAEAPTIPQASPESVQRATTQMLPGRLQPLDPTIIQQEIRFIRVPGEEQVVTIGWKLGEPPGHVTLNHRTVQPLHARMTYRNGEWWIENLADLDPLVVNRTSLSYGASPRLLRDGDRIQIGAVAFRFCFP